MSFRAFYIILSPFTSITTHTAELMAQDGEAPSSQPSRPARYTEPFLQPVWPRFSPRKPGELESDGLKQTKQFPNLSVPVHSQQCFWTQLLEKDDTPKQV